ncbi:MAG: chemotaxis protein CheD [Burkholderiales bacterium]|nr:chemotaxis protein CheD [Burkholderiales bacterium]
MIAEVDALQQTLHPGDVACGVRGDRFDTLLGSCVAVVLTDPRRTVGAMCHIVHATHTPGLQRDSAWGDVALDLMYRLLRARGIEPRLCEAYVYGGGNMFPALFNRGGDVGANNARWTIDALAHDGVRVLHHDLGGTTYRRLRWTVGPDAPQVVAVAV